ncbi:MFS transporter [Pseudoxanthomonas helianthi]|uniref:MFS transporter n=1 Tax=Pseudoxanthomonas helianthi TaxID=1453541 RepID=A0A940WYF2_9GAMM|nr:MFS transporter [Pseudoxanthomonas helianthi]MBP3983289.1 MFS transporter [Pseudoxanthomonas helianthi]
MSSHNQFQLLRQRRFLPFFVTQCFGAFNDNVFRQAIIGLLFWMQAPPAQRTLYASLAPAIFILPYFLFSATAGQIAEKLDKDRLIRITTTMEIFIMSLAALAFVLKALPLLLVALFATGVQSTLFGPVKYSILPAVLHPRELTGGNGLVEMGTSVSILLGMLAGGMIFEVSGAHGPWVAGATVIALAVCGNLASRMIPHVGAALPELRINWNPLPESLDVLRLARKQLAVRNAVLGVSWFWFVGTVFATQLPDYAPLNLGGSNLLYVFVLALFSIGTGVGSMLCEKLSARTVEIGLVPLGAFGMSAFLFDLYFARSGTATAHGLDVAGFMAQPGSWRIVVDLVGIGLFAGFFVVPLFALIQSRTPKTELSRVIGALNIQNSGFVVAASLICLALRTWAGWSIPQIFLALAIANTLVAIWIFTIVPEFLMRFLSWLLVRTLYRLRLRGIDHVPDEGAALIVCNHVSYMDALILSASIPRPVRFVMYYRIFNIPVMSWIFRTAKAIPIAGAKEDPVLMQRAFDEVDAALADGQLVCVFPEGALTKNGDIAPFKSGVEKILERRPVPVIPMALKNMWGSMWSRRDSRLGRMRVPRRLRAHVEVVADAPVDGAGATAESLETAVHDLRGDAA